MGGGAAGLSAALLLARARRRVLICDAGQPRNRHSNRLGGFLTRDGTDPAEFRRIARDELADYDTAELRENTVITAARRFESGFELETASGEMFSGRKLLVATGVADALPPIAGIEGFYGRTVWHCPYCDGYEHRDQRIVVYGRGGKASALALELTGWTSRLMLASDGPSGLSAAQRRLLDRHKIALYEEPVARLEGAEGQLESLVFASGDSVAADALFFPSEGWADVELLRSLGVTIRRNGSVRTGGYGKTGAPGVFVAGDASRHAQLAIIAAGEGAAAAFAINTELLKQDLRHLDSAE
ncbi:NAD(P)/FAD-dependent oxidoreductase [Devosia sp. YIM 151766]|uniref:NAD(P)/FAD-dependent oxidoreductase n=1 Tax=Devosia sp. YIM 151766 TaxID=3017325 RepID=UPI00255C3634|nr:NAD(P)/FAD-dependent oxidoreductase [Devosia sp. YIM 151766]WIY53576.1 NAD(P)/FAD-dependent oxidoreductase [Devosia sp. YIM 151766]